METTKTRELPDIMRVHQLWDNPSRPLMLFSPTKSQPSTSAREPKFSRSSPYKLATWFSSKFVFSILLSAAAAHSTASAAAAVVGGGAQQCQAWLLKRKTRSPLINTLISKSKARSLILALLYFTELFYFTKSYF